MTQTVNVNFKLDADVKKSMEKACAEMGLTMSAAFTVFAKKVGRERRIPFEISADPFYSESNMAHLLRGIAALNAGKGIEHEPVEVDDEWKKCGSTKLGMIICTGKRRIKKS